jgi:hypothetical protein
MLPNSTHSLHHFGRRRRLSRSNRRVDSSLMRLLIRKAGKPKIHFKDLQKIDEGDSGGQPVDNELLLDGEVTTVPAPIPDTGSHDSSATSQPTVTTTSVSSSSTETMKSVYPTPVTLTLTRTTSVIYTSSGTTATSSTAMISPAAAAAGNHRAPSHALSTAIITLIAVGSSFVLFAGFIIFKTCTRPRRRRHPTPSLPILNEFPDKFSADDSPLFGGKERCPSSDRLDNIGFWPRFQQNQPEIIRYPSDVKYGQYNKPEDKGIGSQFDVEKEAESNSREKVEVPIPRVVVEPPQQSAVQQATSALQRVVSRLSTNSTLLYPGSPLNAQDVGVAVYGSPSLSTDTDSVFHRPKSKMSMKRDRLSLGVRDTNSWRSSQGLAYDLGSPNPGSPMPTSQSIPAITQTSSAGRSRIKSSYFAPGGYPSLLHPPSSFQNFGISGTREFDPSSSLFVDAEREARRNQETKALTSALGLRSPSPPPPSPQPTLYPEDSLSRRTSMKTSGSRIRKKSISKPLAAMSPTMVMSPSTETTTALGALMLADFGGTTTTLPSVGCGKEPVTPSASLSSVLGSLKRLDDKPPRVPSPPTLPSLTQMALAHTNPEEYADYRSPTYSIYGLYQGDRKSRVNSVVG